MQITAQFIPYAHSAIQHLSIYIGKNICCYILIIGLIVRWVHEIGWAGQQTTAHPSLTLSPVIAVQLSWGLPGQAEELAWSLLVLQGIEGPRVPHAPLTSMGILPLASMEIWPNWYRWEMTCINYPDLYLMMLETVTLNKNLSSARIRQALLTGTLELPELIRSVGHLVQHPVWQQPAPATLEEETLHWRVMG